MSQTRVCVNARMAYMENDVPGVTVSLSVPEA